MARIKDIIEIIEDFAPLSLQGDFDNCGLKCGDINQDVHAIMVTLDTNEHVVVEAIEKGCNLIIEHHPSIFHSIKKLDMNLPIIRAISLAIKNDIVIYSAHTNVDFCDGGLNDFTALQIGLRNIRKINSSDSPRIDILNDPKTLSEYADFIGKVFNDKHVTEIGDGNKLIKTAAIVNGAGGSHEEDLLAAMAAGADVFVTGDIKYSVARLAKDANYAIIQVGHYNSEQGFMPLIEKLLQDKVDVPVYSAKKLLNPYN